MKTQLLTLNELMDHGVSQQLKFEKENPQLVADAAHAYIDPNELDKIDTIPPTAIGLINALKVKSQPSINLKFTSKPKLPTTSIYDVAITTAQELYPDIILDSSQRFALQTLMSNQYSCMIGAAGTGKTTVTKFFLAALEQLPEFRINPPVVKTVSFTGRATEQIKRQLPDQYKIDCKTIHLTLEYKPIDEEYTDKETGEQCLRTTFIPTRTALTPLDEFDILLVDEAGTVPIGLWNNLIAALPSGVRIILLGDINQLPPVFGKSVLGYAMLKWPVAELTQIHRQASDNPIIANAHRVLRGETPIADNKKFFMITIPDAPLQASHTILRIVAEVHKQGAYDPLKDTVITAQNVGDLGQTRLNEFFVTHFNPPNNDPVTNHSTNPRIFIDCVREQKHFAIGDKVLLTANDTQRGLTNGMTGRVVSISLNGHYRVTATGRQIMATKENLNIDSSQQASVLSNITGHQQKIDALDTAARDDIQSKANDIDYEGDKQLQASHITTIIFNERPDREYTFGSVGQYSKLQHGYAVTCHKAQGGEYETVIIVLHATQTKMFSREWFYTAITRARNKIIIVYNDYNNKGLTVATTRQRIKGDTLAEKAQQFIDQSGNNNSNNNSIIKESEKPVLCEPKLWKNN